MAYGSLNTKTTGELVSAANYNTMVNNWTWLASLLRNTAAISGLANSAQLMSDWVSRAFNSGTLTHNNTGGWFTLTFDSENYDDGAMHSTGSNTQNFSVPVDGIYLCTVGVLWASNAVGSRGVRVQRGGTTFGEAYGPSGSVSTAGAFVLSATAGQNITFDSFQSSGGNLNMTASGSYGIHATVSWIGVHV